MVTPRIFFYMLFEWKQLLLTKFRFSMIIMQPSIADEFKSYKKHPQFLIKGFDFFSKMK